MPDEKKQVLKTAKTTISATKFKSSVKTVDKKIVEELTKAFGNDVAYHIKESGPTWVNSPKTPLELDQHQLVERNVQIVIHNTKKPGR